MSANSDGPLVKVRDLRKSFGQNEVLRGVDLDVARGEVVSVIGASGSGKTTMLRCVNLLETYDSGSITVDGVEVGYSGEGPGAPPPRRARARAHSRRHRHGFSAVQSVSASDRAGERDAGPAQGAQAEQGRGGRHRRSLAGARRPRRQARQPALRIVRRSAAARRHCARGRHESESAAARRDHFGARP